MPHTPRPRKGIPACTSARGPCPPLCPRWQGRNLLEFPHGHVRLHSPHESRPSPNATHLEAATWTRPGKGCSPGPPNSNCTRETLPRPDPQLLNSTKVSSGTCSEAEGARPPGQRRRGLGRRHGGPNTPRPTPAQGLTCRRGHGAGVAGAGAEKLGALVPPRRHENAGIYIGQPSATSSNTSCSGVTGHVGAARP